MATKYHFNKDTGRTGKCEAKIKCRLGLADSEHFATREEAQAAYEKTMDSKAVSPLKKTTSKEVKNIDRHKFSGKSFGYPELEGKTAAEIRQYVIDIHDKYDGYEEVLKKDIAEQIGLSTVPGFDDDYSVHTSIDHYNGVLEVSRDVHVYYPTDYDEEYHYNDPDVTDYYGDGYEDIEGYTYSELEIRGYYNEDSYVNSRYRIPNNFKEDLEGLKKLYKYDRYYRNASNENLPDWASVPEKMIMDEARNKKFVSQNGDKKTSAPFFTRPKDPSTRINKLNKIIENDKEIERLLKANRALVRRSNEAVEKLHEIRDYERSDNKRAFVFEKNPEYRGLSQTDRRRARNMLESSIDSLNTQYLRNARKIEAAENITKADKEQAASKISEISKEYEDASRAYKIGKLSNLYPHSKQSVRDEKAAEWVDTHPDLSIDDL